MISYSLTLLKNARSGKMLEKDGIDAEVIDLRTLPPIDRDTLIASAKKNRKGAGYARKRRKIWRRS